ncbi:ATP-binding protein [Streptomyces sp. NPDC127119]|uniref:ATP-binding protein n=1 Tax=Streptomyces sp. NPDC127119 TaxID=3345370 RepID=UPI003640E696
MALIGRGPELATVTAVVDRARAGSGGALLISGEPGIGKTALLEHLLTGLAPADVRVLTTVATERDAHLPFAGLSRLLASVRSHGAALPPAQRAALAGAFDSGAFDETGAVDAEDNDKHKDKHDDADTADPFPVALATLGLLAEAATRLPLLLVVEDLHLLDAASATALAFVARRLASEPVALLAALREGLDSPLNNAGLPTLALKPLDAAHAADVVDGQAPGLSPSLRERVLAEAGGNPLALTELTRAARQGHAATAVTTAWLPLSTRLEKAFRSRVAALPSRTRTLLVIAAVDDGSPLTEILDVARLVDGEPAGVEDLAPAVDAHLITLSGDALRFRHPLMRAAVLSGTSTRRHHAVRAALAKVLDHRTERRIRQPVTAQPSPADVVAAALEEANRRIERPGGVMSAVSALEHAARLAGRPEHRTELLLHAADIAVESGRHDEVVRLLNRAASDPLTAQQQARVTWTSARFQENVHADADAYALAALAEEVASGGDTGLALRILWTAARRNFWLESGEDAARYVADLALRLPFDNEPQVLAILAYTAPMTQGAHVIARLRHWAAHPSGDATADRFLGTAAVLVGAFDLAAGFSAASLSGLRAQGRLFQLVGALAARGWSAALLCDLAVAVPSAAEADRLSQETGQTLLQGTARCTKALIAALQGELEDAERLAQESIDLGSSLRARPVLATARMALAQVAAARGAFDEALQHLRQLQDPAAAAYHPTLRYYALIDLVDVAQRAHRTEEVRDLVRRMEVIARKTPSTALHVGVRFARAVLAHEDEDAERHFLEALAADLTRWPFARARTQLAYGEWLRRRRRDAQARGPLRAARDAFDALGAVAFSERSRRELRASGEAGSERVPRAHELLNPQELQIATLAAEGLTNREIGERLHLSHRTVSNHLHRIFPKLGVTSRTALGHLLRSAD